MSSRAARSRRSAPARQPARAGQTPRGNSGRRAPRPVAPVPQYTLATLVAELKERAEAGESQNSLIEWLYSLTSGLGIRMRYDEHSSDSRSEPVGVSAEASAETSTKASTEMSTKASAETSAKASAETSAKTTSAKKASQPVPFTIENGRMAIHFGDAALQERAPPASGRFDHLTEGDTFVARIILSCDRRSIRVDAPLCAECNGAVIDARTWTHLVVPPRAFAPRPATKEVDRALAVPDADGQVRTGLYDIIQVSDGTVVTLYRWNHPLKGPIWCLASSNGYDVSHLKWMGDKTYAELVYDLLSACPGFAEAAGLELLTDYLCENDVRLSFGAAVDPDRCYTIGFRHPNFHPMGADPPGVWNIQAAVLATGMPQYVSEAPGLPLVPCQATYSRDDVIRLALAGGRHGVGSDGTGLQLADLDHISRTALEDAMAVIAGEAPTVPPLPAAEGVHICPFNYGFILRSRDPAATGVCSDVLCESPLLRQVRQLVYQRPTRQVRDELDESSRLEYNALKAFLTATDRDTFLALFPEFKHRFAIYKEFVDNVIHLVLHMQRQNAMSPNSRVTDTEGKPRTQTKAVARAMLTHILRHEKDFKAFHQDARSIVHDFVVRPEYAVLYLRAIGLPSAPAKE